MRFLIDKSTGFSVGEPVSNFAELNNKVSAGVKCLTLKGIIDINSDYELPPDVHLIIPNGAGFKVESGATLTVNCSFDAGLYQIFYGDGDLSGNPKIEAAYPEWFGAKGDGVADDTNAIHKAIYFYDNICFSKNYIISSPVPLLPYKRYFGLAVKQSFKPTIKLANSANCNIFENLADAGVHGCCLEGLTLNGNREHNTVGNGICIKHFWSNTIIRNVKVTHSPENAVCILGSSAPVWITDCTFFTSGKNGVYVDGGYVQAINLLNVQVDNAGLLDDGNLYAGIYIERGSGATSNFNIINFRFEKNVSFGNPTSVGIYVGQLNGSVINVIGCHGMSNSPTTDDAFIIVEDTSSHVCISGATCSNYDKIVKFNQVPSLDVEGYRAVLIADKITTTTIEAFSPDGGELYIVPYGGTIRINKDKGSEALEFYGGNSAPIFRLENNGRMWLRDAQLLLGGPSVSEYAVKIIYGTGDPEGVVFAPVGSLYLRLDGGAGATLYVKESGDRGNTGWVAK